MNLSIYLHIVICTYLCIVYLDPNKTKNNLLDNLYELIKTQMQNKFIFKLHLNWFKSRMKFY